MTNDYSATWPRSEEIKSLQSREQVTILLERLRLFYPQAELPRESIAAYKGEFERLLRESGTARLLAACQQAVRFTPRFPSIADVVRNIPPPPVRSTYEGPSEDDRRRKAAGERSYGIPDVRCLSKLHATRRAKLGRPLVDNERDGLLDELDKQIDAIEAHGKIPISQTAEKTLSTATHGRSSRSA